MASNSTTSSATAKEKTAATQRNNEAPVTRVAVCDRSFPSKALGRDVTYRVVLPAGYANTAHRYPVLYLLHGVFGGFENWETLTNLTRYATGCELIVVTPDGANSWYVNSNTTPADRYEDFVVQDLIPEVEQSWRALRSSHRRAIAGLSMGGYGAVKFALKYPGTFDFAGSISGAFNAVLDLDRKRDDLRDDLRKAFGPAGSVTREQNDIFELLRKADPKQFPYFYLDCGIADEFCEVNRSFAKLLGERGARYEYHEVPGSHSWQYWDQRIQFLLPLVASMITAG